MFLVCSALITDHCYLECHHLRHVIIKNSCCDIDQRGRHGNSRWRPKTGSSFIPVIADDRDAVQSANPTFSGSPFPHRVVPTSADTGRHGNSRWRPKTGSSFIPVIADDRDAVQSANPTFSGSPFPPRVVPTSADTVLYCSVLNRHLEFTTMTITRRHKAESCFCESHLTIDTSSKFLVKCKSKEESLLK